MDSDGFYSQSDVDSLIEQYQNGTLDNSYASDVNPLVVPLTIIGLLLVIAAVVLYIIAM